VATTELKTPRLTPRRLAAVKRRANDLGLTLEKYLQKLIEDDLAVSSKARRASLEELAAPFREALSGVSEAELDRRVKAARVARRNGV